MKIRKYIQRKIGRSGASVCPVCLNKGLLVLHHIKGRKVFDWNRSYSEVWLCASCHDGIYSCPPRIILEGWVSTSEGKKLLWHRLGEEPIANDGMKTHIHGDRHG